MSGVHQIGNFRRVELHGNCCFLRYHGCDSGNTSGALAPRREVRYRLAAPRAVEPESVKGSAELKMKTIAASGATLGWPALCHPERSEGSFEPLNRTDQPFGTLRPDVGPCDPSAQKILRFAQDDTGCETGTGRN